MMSAVLIAAETITEHSKTAFYICGGILVAFAIVISAVGVRGAATFPGSLGARRGLSLLTAVLVIAAMATAVITA